MKKSLVLAMAMALGVTASAYAANPFSDVPAGHWAYDSISKLAAAGVIEGYGDDTFRGDRLMTRYEMAQIVAKAMAKGANVDKLAAEFADELDALGVRVAALEKKSDNVRITGEVRYHWATAKESWGNQSNKGVAHRFRTRLTFNGQINDGWKYVGMIQNEQDFRNYVGDEQGNSFVFQRAYLEGRLGGMKVTAGRYHKKIGGGDPDIYAHRVDGIELRYGIGKGDIGFTYGKPSGPIGTRNGLYEKFWAIDAKYDIAKNWNLYAGYTQFEEGQNGVNPRQKIANIGVKGKFGKAWGEAQYMKGAYRGVQNKNGFTVELGYGGAKYDKVGTWGVSLKYYDQGDGTYWSGSHGADMAGVFNLINNGASIFDEALLGNGFRGFRIAADYTVAKNIVGKIEYFDIKTKDAFAGNKGKGKQLWTQLMFRF